MLTSVLLVLDILKNFLFTQFNILFSHFHEFLNKPLLKLKQDLVDFKS
jgi:hypothetical protein